MGDLTGALDRIEALAEIQEGLRSVLDELAAVRAEIAERAVESDRLRVIVDLACAAYGDATVAGERAGAALYEAVAAEVTRRAATK